jgi:uncharacterized protein YegL
MAQSTLVVVNIRENKEADIPFVLQDTVKSILEVLCSQRFLSGRADEYQAVLQPERRMLRLDESLAELPIGAQSRLEFSSIGSAASADAAREPTIPDVAFARGNFSERLPCVILVDASGSMAGTPIKALNEGLQVLEQELKADDVASQRVQLLVLTFGGQDDVSVVRDWTDALAFSAPSVKANGATPTGKAVQLAMEKIEEQKQRYKANAITYKRPWLFLLTDGAPTDDWAPVADQCRAAEQAGRFVFFGIGIGAGADMTTLARFSARGPVMLDGLKFRDLFVWLSHSAGPASRAIQGQNVQMASPSAWMQIPT